jgi:hypothetical protein
MLANLGGRPRSLLPWLQGDGEAGDVGSDADHDDGSCHVWVAPDNIGHLRLKTLHLREGSIGRSLEHDVEETRVLPGQKTLRHLLVMLGAPDAAHLKPEGHCLEITKRASDVFGRPFRS